MAKQRDTIDRREAQRLALQCDLDRLRPAAERNMMGQFSTPSALALDMAALGGQPPARANDAHRSHGRRFPVGVPELVLLDCDLPFEDVRANHNALAAYLRQGEHQGIPLRYLPAHRTLWYRQEQRPPAPILCTYMGRQNGGRGLRLLRNRSDATAPNVYLLLYPRPAIADLCRRQPGVIDRLFAALAEVASDPNHGGRVYGGGLNKIEPKELEAIALPSWVRELFGRAVQPSRRARTRPVARVTSA